MRALVLTLLVASSAAIGTYTPVVAETKTQVADQLASSVAELARAASGEFRIAVSGGSALELLEDGLSRLSTDQSVKWDNWRVFLVDERCVPVDHEHSNYNAMLGLTTRLPLKPDQLLPSAELITSSLSSDSGCASLADQYDKLLHDVGQAPDVVVLGMGADGHTASIFPGSTASSKGRVVFYEPNSPKLPAERVSISMDVINSASNVFVVATGAAKQPALLQALCTRNPALPIALVKPSSGKLLFFMDAPAAPEHCLRGQHFVWFGSRGALAKKYSWRMLLQLHRKGSMRNSLVHAVGSDPLERGTQFVTSLAHEKDLCPPEEAAMGKHQHVLMDINGDGLVDQQEFVAGSPDELFSKFDLNSDGHLDLEESGLRTCSYAVGHFLDRMSYSQLTRTKDQHEVRAQYVTLGNTMRGLADGVYSTSEYWNSPRSVFYLSVPPSAYVKTIKMVSDVVLGPRPWAPGTTFLIEKPFGFDLKDVRSRQSEYNQAGLQEPEIWRLDHYLGKQGVRNMLDFRRQNPQWDARWNGEHIERVEVVVQEDEDVADRVDYYGETGAVRDMMINHLMAVLATAGMKLPTDPVDAGVKRAQFVSKIAPLTRADLVVAQYDEYLSQLSAHHEAKPEARKCEHAGLAPTAALATMRSVDPHWAGTSFVVAHGKATDSRQAYTKVVFKDGTELTFHIQGGKRAEYVAVKLAQAASSAPFQMGEGWSTEKHSELVWVSEPIEESLNAYEALYRDALLGDKSHYVTYDEVEAAYAVWDSVLEYDSQPGTYAKGASLGGLLQGVGPAEDACPQQRCLWEVLDLEA